MSDAKVFDKADLLMFFDEDIKTARPIGTFSSIQKEGQGDLFTNARRTHFVRALTRVMFCEKHRFAVVEQRVAVSDFGLFALPKDHPYRDEILPRLMLLRGHMCHNSADLSREIVRIADEWREEMAAHVPEGVIDTTKPAAAEPAPVVGVNAALGSVAGQINAGALDTDNVRVRAKATPTTRGKRV